MVGQSGVRGRGSGVLVVRRVYPSSTIKTKPSTSYIKNKKDILKHPHSIQSLNPRHTANHPTTLHHALQRPQIRLPPQTTLRRRPRHAPLRRRRFLRRHRPRKRVHRLLPRGPRARHRMVLGLRLDTSRSRQEAAQPDQHRDADGFEPRAGASGSYSGGEE